MGVAGVAALLWSYLSPSSLNTGNLHNKLIPDFIRKVEKVDNMSGKLKTGGVINALRAFKHAQEGELTYEDFDNLTQLKFPVATSKNTTQVFLQNASTDSANEAGDDNNPLRFSSIFELKTKSEESM